jgi:hypothetical protein
MIMADCSARRVPGPAPGGADHRLIGNRTPLRRLDFPGLNAHLVRQITDLRRARLKPAGCILPNPDVSTGTGSDFEGAGGLAFLVSACIADAAGHRVRTL